jgi:hypothetical protein
MNTTGNVNVNGVFTKVTALLDENYKIDTPGQNGALVTGQGNAIALGANAQFTLQSNAFALDGGASNVNTSTGMATKVKEYTIQPVDPKLQTQFEVNYEDDGVYVYARVKDVDIIGPCDRRWRLEQGKAVKIPDPRRCGGLIWLDHVKVWPYAVAWGSAFGAGVGVIVCLSLQNHSPSMSASGPCD